MPVAGDVCQPMKEADIWRTAKEMIQQYGAEALTRARQRADKLREYGITEGSEEWSRVAEAIAELERKKKADEVSRPTATNHQAGGTKKEKRKRTFPYRKVPDIEADIAEAETELRELERLMASPELYRDGDKVKETTKAFEETKVRLHQLYEHWEEAVELN